MAKAQQIVFDFGFTEPEQPENINTIPDMEVPKPATLIKPEFIYKESTGPLEEDSFSEETEPIIHKTTPPKPGTRGRKSIKDMELEADLIAIPADEILFSKQYYTMQEITSMFRVNHSLIRFWENEFSILQPRKNKKGDRLFRPEDVKNLAIIYYLLRQKKYTIDGAKDYLKNKKKLLLQFEQIKKLETLKAFLLEIKTALS
jgi:DNA-binding transcriptional MerR regulator